MKKSPKTGANGRDVPSSATSGGGEDGGKTVNSPGRSVPSDSAFRVIASHRTCDRAGDKNNGAPRSRRS
jgi:hypothetical protein